MNEQQARAFVAGLYRELLGRDGSAEEHWAWARHIVAGTHTPEQIRTLIASSDEAVRRAGTRMTAAQAFAQLQAAHTQIFNRAGAASDIQAMADYVASGAYPVEHFVQQMRDLAAANPSMVSPAGGAGGGTAPTPGASPLGGLLEGKIFGLPKVLVFGGIALYLLSKD